MKTIRTHKDAPASIQEIIYIVHGQQKRRDGSSYISGHLDAVLDIFNENIHRRLKYANTKFEDIRSLQIACLCHDLYEDCKPEDISTIRMVLKHESFLAHIIVETLTKPSLDSSTLLQYAEKIVSTKIGHIVSAIKLCDMCSNITSHTTRRAFVGYNVLFYAMLHRHKELCANYPELIKLFNSLRRNFMLRKNIIELIP